MHDSTCFQTFRALTENKAILYTIIDVKFFCFVVCFFFFFQIYNIIAKHFFSLCGAFDDGRAVETTWTSSPNVTEI